MSSNRPHPLRILRGLALPLPLAAALLVPVAAGAANAPLQLEMRGARGYAKGGLSGYASYAVVSVLVTRGVTGLTEPGLAATVGDGTPLPALPPGFTLRNLWIQPDPIPTPCAPVPVYFRNQGNGAYAIYLAPGSDPACAWHSGDYVVGLQVLLQAGSDLLAGSGATELHIP